MFYRDLRPKIDQITKFRQIWSIFKIWFSIV